MHTATSMIHIVPTTSLSKFMPGTVISLPAFVKGNALVAEQML